MPFFFHFLDPKCFAFKFFWTINLGQGFFYPNICFPKLLLDQNILFWQNLFYPIFLYSFSGWFLCFNINIQQQNNKNNTNLMCFETIKIKLALVIFPIYTEPRFWITPWFNFLGRFEAEKLSNYKDLINVAGHPLWPLSKGSYA